MKEIKNLLFLIVLAVWVFGAAFTANEEVTSTKFNNLDNANITASAGIDPEKIDDHSSTNAEMDQTFDPYLADVQTKPTDLSLELKAIRFQLQQLLRITPGALATEKWYNDPGVQTRVLVIQNNAQSIPNAAWTKVTLDVESLDNNNEFAANRFTAKVAGGYLVNIAATWNSAAANTWAAIDFYKNGVIANRAQAGYTFAAFSLPLSATAIFNLAVNDYIEMYARQDTGVALNLLGGQQWMDVVRLW